MMDQINLLDDVLAKNLTLLNGVRQNQWDDPTPCTAFNVSDLVTHMVSWLRVFGAAANGTTFEGDPNNFQLSADAPSEFAAGAEQLIAGWRRDGTDRLVRLTSAEIPAQMVFDITLMEYLTHGWDLARATNQHQPFTDDETSETLRRAKATLPEGNRGEGMSFGHIIPVPDESPVIDRFIGFMGRQP